MFGKNTSSGTNVHVNVTLDLSSPSLSGTTTINELAIADSGSTITGANAHELHFNNTDGYYGFHINNYPYFYVNTYSCYVNTTLGINTNQEQIVFYRENNFWYFFVTPKKIIFSKFEKCLFFFLYVYIKKISNSEKKNNRDEVHQLRCPGHRGPCTNGPACTYFYVPQNRE